jgi:hypothetical protein
VALDSTILAQFPVGYRHLAYIQTAIGYTVKRDMPSLSGDIIEALYVKGQRCLLGAALGP